jgi:transcriptional regulator GlxA family with amidase domain
MGRSRKELGSSPAGSERSRGLVGPDSRPLLGQTSEKILTLEGTKALARRKSVSLRTLHRRLAEHGLDASAIQDGEKKRLILDLLGTELSLKEIATRLAVSGPQSFSRLVRRLFGTTPGELRSNLKASAEG